MPATLQVTHRTIGAEVRRHPYDVLVDGTVAGVVTMNETIDLAVAPGRHTVQVRSGRNSSGVQAFEIADGGVVRFRCGGKSILPKFLLSFVIPSWALTLRRE
ncbi:hypothetical protein [Nakamurella sp.]|uniref:hypothetical protein n=1 Tax=Nakamurella sp. TaxID=1869182 RepID=UPI003B3B8B1A